MDLVVLSSSVATTYEALLILAFILLTGLYAGIFFEKIKLPHITGYITMGVVIGIVLELIGIGSLMHNLKVVSSVALGFIAFGIGAELNFPKLKKSGKEVVVITVLQALAASVFTTLSLIIIGVSLPIALVLGAVATATAPAPIMLLTRKLRSKGPLTDTLLPLVGMDDAVGIILFGVMLSIATSLKTGAGLSVIQMLQAPLLELFFSLLIGSVVGYAVSFIIRYTKTDNSMKEEIYLAVSIFAVFITVALANMGLHIGEFQIHLSPILTPMLMGVILTNNISNVRSREITHTTESFTAPILVAFFTLAGAELVIAFGDSGDVNYLSIAGITATYIVFRIFGKLLGSYIGARVMKSHHNVKKYLGICLLPQAGVALGMAYQAKSDFGEEGTIILIVVLIATLVYELFGPIGITHSLKQSDEITAT